jgi:hypothetical protein
MRKDIVMGTWRFKDSVPEERPVATAQQMASDDINYIQVCPRGVGKDETGRCFVYVPTDIEYSQRELGKTTYNLLSQQFGSDFLGGEMSHSASIKKWDSLPNSQV